MVALFLCNIFYQISLAPLAWLILSEIFPIRVRALGQSAGALIVWISNCVVTQVLGPLMGILEKSFGSAAGAFWVFSAVCAGAFIFGWRLIPETKGKSLEEIADFGAGRQKRQCSNEAVEAKARVAFELSWQSEKILF